MSQKKQIEYKLIKNKNSKKIKLTIKSNQQIIVSAPKYISQKKIDSFVNENRKWIDSTINNMNKNERTKKHSFQNGDCFLYLGELFQINVILNKENKIVVNMLNKIIFIYSKSLDRESIKAQMINFYKNKTNEIIMKIYNNNLILLQNYQSINKIRIHKATTRWGSCSSKNNINFSSRLSMLAYECIEYVFFHEITHLKVKNHGIEFYNNLSKICPNYIEIEKRIRQFEKSTNLNLE